jgi:Fungal specific transcription factor domain
MTDIEIRSFDSLAVVNLYNAAVRQQILGSFFSQSSIMEGPLSGRQPWIGCIPSMPNIGKPLEFAALAMATAKFGRDYSDDRYLNASLQLYGQGLKHIQLALWDPERMYSDETLGACMLLTMFEVVECPTQAGVGFISHHNGCARLIQLRGPQAHVDGLGHSIFLQFRYMAVSSLDFCILK